MTNKLKEAIELVEKSYSKLSLMLESDSAFHTFTSLVMANLSELSFLLQEVNEKEVDLDSWRYGENTFFECPCCKEISAIELTNYCSMCGQKLKWPEQQEEDKSIRCSANK